MTQSDAGASPQRDPETITEERDLPQRAPRTITVNVARTDASRQPSEGTYKLNSAAEVACVSVDWDSKDNLRILLLGPEATPVQVTNAPVIKIQVYVDGQPKEESDPHFYKLAPHSPTVTSVTSEFIDGTLRLTLNTH